MIKNRKLSRAIADAGWGRLVQQVKYKTALRDGTVCQIDQWFPSSKICRKCGEIKATLSLSDRTFKCDGCGHTEDRDLNAAHNICTAGLAGIYACGPEGSGLLRKKRTKPRRVEAGTLKCSLVGTP